MTGNKRKVAIVLGGINAHAELINKLKVREYYTVLIDKSESSPALKHCDEHVKTSIFDKTAVLKTAKKYNADLVISVAAERANTVACYVNERLGLPTPYSSETAIQISDKFSMKNLMAENSIPTSKFILFRGHEFPVVTNMEFPAVLKPADGYGSKGINLVHNIEELNQVISESNPDGRYVLEEFQSGPEYGVYCYVHNSCATIIFINEKNKSLKISGLPSFGTISDPDLSSEQIDSIQNIANQIVATCGLKNTPLLMQVIDTINGFKVIEFSPRLGGGVSYKTIMMSKNFDFLEASINSFLQESKAPVFENNSFKIATVSVFTHPGIYGSIVGVEDLIEEKTACEFISGKATGTYAGLDYSSSSRIGQFIIKAASIGEVFSKIKRIFEKLDVLDIDDNSIIRRDFYMSENNLKGF